MSGLIKLTGTFQESTSEITRFVQESDHGTKDVQVIVVPASDTEIILCEVYDVYQFFERGFAAYLYEKFQRPVFIFNHSGDLNKYPNNRR